MYYGVDEDNRSGMINEASRAFFCNCLLDLVCSTNPLKKIYLDFEVGVRFKCFEGRLDTLVHTGHHPVFCVEYKKRPNWLEIPQILCEVSAFLKVNFAGYLIIVLIYSLTFRMHFPRV